MSNYHAEQGISRGMLNVAAHSWNKFGLLWNGMLPNDFEEPSPAILKGVASHVALLQPELLNQFVPIPPNVLSDTGRRQGRRWSEFVQQARKAGKTPLSHELMATVGLITFRVRSLLGPLLESASQRAFELPLFWRSPTTHLPCKALLDFTYVDGFGRRVIIDLKVSDEFSRANFVRKSRAFGYWLQDVHYREAAAVSFNTDIRNVDFIFVCVEGVLPHRVRLRTFAEQSVAAFARRREELLSQILQRSTSGDWSEPGEMDIEEVEHSL